MAHLFFDFDSTVCTKESLDEVIALALKNHPQKDTLVAEIEHITTLGMEGVIDFKASLIQRLSVTTIDKTLFDQVGDMLTQHITPGIPEIFEWLQSHSHQTYIVSGGFIPCILPTAKILKVPSRNCFANECELNDKGEVIGANQKNLLWTDQGKVPVIKFLKKDRNISETTVMVGDGSNDLRAYEEDCVDIFCGFGVNVVRKKVQKKAPNFFTKSEELLHFLKTTLQ